MQNAIETAINHVRTNVSKLKSSDDNKIFGFVCYSYFYNEGKLDNSDIQSVYTDGPNDGGIDFITTEETESSKNLVLIQSKNVEDFHSKDDIKDIFAKMAQTVKDFEVDTIGSYNANLRRIYRENYDDASDDPNFNIQLVLFIGVDKNDDTKRKIEQHLEKVEELQDFIKTVHYKNEIEQQIEKVLEPQRYVATGKVKIFKDHGKIKYGDNGLLVDISALALRKLYDQYKDKGLFEQNFRYYVRNTKIDSQISTSLSSKRKQFWFLNNGIIIGCKDFWEDGNEINLVNFSIINGCQTTTMIGKYTGKNEAEDFPITCKIVKPEQDTEAIFDEFITSIAEASNSQKPILDRDLKSNALEQKKFKSALEQHDPPIFLEIKRGSKTSLSRSVEPWQKIKNDYLGQLILAFNLQQPGTARSSKKKIFADSTIYNKVFKRDHDIDTIADLVLLSSYYDDFKKEKDLSDLQANIAKNGKLAILSIIGILIKYKRNLIDFSKIDFSKPNTVHEQLSKDNLKGKIFSEDRADDFLLALNSLFIDIIGELATLYTGLKEQESSVTNFFKTDRKYYIHVVERIKTQFIIDEWKYKQIEEKMKIFN